MVRTGANAYVKYDYEDDYGTGASPDKSFGLKTAVTSWSLTTNRTALATLGQVEPTTFAYGQQQGTLGIGFVLGDTTSHSIFQAIYGVPADSGTDKVYGGLTAGSAAKAMNPDPAGSDNTGLTFTTEIGFDLETGNVDVRTLKGCVLNTLSIAAAVNDTVNCTADITYGKEDAPSASFGTAVTETSKPFTFAHGTLSLRNSSGVGEAIAELQEADVNFTQNSDLLYQLGTNQAVKGIKRILEITGRFRASWKDQTKVNALINQMRTGVGSSTFKETWGDAYAGSGAEFNLTFDNNDGKSIVIILSGLSFMDHAVTGLEPVEPVFEELNWQAKQCQITADVS